MRMFSIILELYTKTMINNDVIAYLAVVDKLTSVEMAGSLRLQIL